MKDIGQSDSTDYLPSLPLIGSKWKHTNGRVYLITGFVWDGELDMWRVKHIDTSDDADPETEYVRTPVNFFGLNKDHKSRFEWVSSGPPPTGLEDFSSIEVGPKKYRPSSDTANEAYLEVLLKNGNDLAEAAQLLCALHSNANKSTRFPDLKKAYEKWQTDL